MSSIGNFKPTDQAIAFKNEMFTTIDKELTDLKKVFNEDVKELNKRVKESDIDLIKLD